MAKKKANKKMMKQLRKAASPTRAALMGALGGAAVMWLGRDRFREGIERVRLRMGKHDMGGAHAHAAE